MQLQVLSPHFDKGVRNYLQIPFRDGFFLHTELQVLHFPEEEKRHKEQSVTEISIPVLSNHCTWASPARLKSERRRTHTTCLQTAQQKLHSSTPEARQLIHKLST